MRRRWLQPGLAGLGVALGVVLVAGRILLACSRPQRSDELALHGLHAALEIRYDDQIAASLGGEHDALAAAPEAVAGRALRLRPAQRPAR